MTTSTAGSAYPFSFVMSPKCSTKITPSSGQTCKNPAPQIHFAWDYMAESDAVLRGLRRYVEHGKKNRHGKFGSVYVLTNYDTSMEENLYRIYTLRDMGFDPYVMIYDKPNATREIRLLQRWCNNRLVFLQFHRADGPDVLRRQQAAVQPLCKVHPRAAVRKLPQPVHGHPGAAERPRNHQGRDGLRSGQPPAGRSGAYLPRLLPVPGVDQRYCLRIPDAGMPRLVPGG